jgi:type IV pilus assembly protein PilE
MNHLHSRRMGGFTLIELMIVVAVIGILGAIAYPAYTDQVRKGRRAEARAGLMNLLQQQERFMTQRNTYAAFAAGAASAGTPFKDHIGDSEARASHLLGAQICQAVNGVTPAISDCVEVFAQPQANVHTDPDVTLMAIDTQGRRRCTGLKTDRCWH